MDARIYIVDDDAVIRKLLKKVIDQYNLGVLVGESGNGKKALDDIRILQPDIALVDLLLPDFDGISIVSKAKEWGLDTSFVMISQVDSKDMISQAYESEIDFYINKPVNAKEVESVIEKVKENRRMKKIIHDINKAVSGVNELQDFLGTGKEESNHEDKIRNILYQLGIAGDRGGDDLTEIILFIRKNRESKKPEKMKMYEIYKCVSDKYEMQGKSDISPRSMEQRVRRTVAKALRNVASLGVNDFDNEIFNRYSNTLFDFEEVRNEMNYIQNRTKYNGKVNIRKFIEGILVEIQG